MPVDHIRYDILVQEALRGMVRGVLTDIVKTGLPGEHHFFITFDTNAEGARLSDRLRAQYPEEMTVVLQHQFWDLKVTEEAFEVGLSFGGVAERLFVPFTSIKAFADPSVQFTLQFESLTEEADDEATHDDSAGSIKGPAREQPKSKPQKSARGEPARTSVPVSPLPAPSVAETPADKPSEGDKQGDKQGAEVVRLDRFRKK